MLPKVKDEVLDDVLTLDDDSDVSESCLVVSTPLLLGK